MPSAPPDALFLAFQSAVAGRYSLERELGRGGMGVVFLAREVHLDRLVAIKVLPPAHAENPSLRERFLQEARIAARLSHPSIVPIHAVEQHADFVFYVMSFVDGDTLAERVQTRGPLSPGDGVRVLRDVAWALGYAHGQGVVHRDVKPENILIERATGRAMVADFGIAAAIGSVSDRAYGTPEYMSPEQVLDGQCDARSDLYSLGVTAFFALSGRLPFAGATTAAVIAQHMSTTAPSLVDTGLSVPRSLATIVDRCLSKRPEARPASADIVADQLGATIEQRRELPAVLRAFVKRTGRMDGGGTVAALIATLLASVGASAMVNATTGALVFIAGLATMPLVFGVTAARQLLDQGFRQADLAPAYRAALETGREERRSVSPRGFTWGARIERMLARLAGVAASTTLLAVPVALLQADGAARTVTATLAAVAAALTAVAGFGRIAMLQLRRDVDIEFWRAAWTGGYGTLSFALARRWRGNAPVAKAMTHRATELSLSVAAEELFEALPRATRAALPEIPALVHRLQRDAHQLRTRHDALNLALDGARASCPADSNAPDLDVLTEERDRVRARLGETVGALERVRLGLLRLHAGTISPDGFTTQLGLADDAAADIERLAAANAEVQALLSSSTPALTPA